MQGKWWLYNPNMAEFECNIEDESINIPNTNFNGTFTLTETCLSLNHGSWNYTPKSYSPNVILTITAGGKDITYWAREQGLTFVSIHNYFVEN